jgi:hypothetical protein
MLKRFLYPQLGRRAPVFMRFFSRRFHNEKKMCTR